MEYDWTGTRSRRLSLLRRICLVSLLAAATSLLGLWPRMGAGVQQPNPSFAQVSDG